VAKLILIFRNPANEPIKSMKRDKWRRIAWPSVSSFISATSGRSDRLDLDST
jgi:hypothetical protein